MPEIGAQSRSFLRSSMINYAELAYDNDGNSREVPFLKPLLQKNIYGFVLQKKYILKICRENGIKYRMVFNAMNMREYSKDEITATIEGVKDELEEIGVAGIVEFHAADKTQNSDHIHLWINSDDAYVYNRIANFLVEQKATNKEDVHIQKYMDNTPIPKEMLFDNEEHDENYSTKEEQEAITQAYLVAMEIENEFKESEDEDGISITDIRRLQREEPRIRESHSDLLPKLSDLNMDASGEWGDADDYSMVPFNEEGILHSGMQTNNVMRPEGEGYTRDVDERTIRLNGFKKRVESLKNKMRYFSSLLKNDVGYKSKEGEKVLQTDTEVIDAKSKRIEELYALVSGDKSAHNKENKVTSTEASSKSLSEAYNARERQQVVMRRLR